VYILDNEFTTYNYSELNSLIIKYIKSDANSLKEWFSNYPIYECYLKAHILDIKYKFESTILNYENDIHNSLDVLCRYFSTKLLPKYITKKILNNEDNNKKIIFNKFIDILNYNINLYYEYNCLTIDNKKKSIKYIINHLYINKENKLLKRIKEETRVIQDYPEIYMLN